MALLATVDTYEAGLNDAIIKAVAPCLTTQIRTGSPINPTELGPARVGQSGLQGGELFLRSLAFIWEIGPEQFGERDPFG